MRRSFTESYPARSPDSAQHGRRCRACTTATLVSAAGREESPPRHDRECTTKYVVAVVITGCEAEICFRTKAANVNAKLESVTPFYPAQIVDELRVPGNAASRPAFGESREPVDGEVRKSIEKDVLLNVLKVQIVHEGTAVKRKLGTRRSIRDAAEEFIHQVRLYYPRVIDHGLLVVREAGIGGQQQRIGADVCTIFMAVAAEYAGARRTDGQSAHPIDCYRCWKRGFRQSWSRQSGRRADVRIGVVRNNRERRAVEPALRNAIAGERLTGKRITNRNARAEVTCFHLCGGR